MRGEVGLSLLVYRRKRHYPLGCLQHPNDVCLHVRGDGNMQFFTLTVLQEQSAQVPLLSNNVVLYREDYCPQQYGACVFPVPKGQDRQKLFITHPEPHITSSSSSPCASTTPTHSSTPYSNSATTGAAAASAAGFTSTSTDTVASTTAATTSASHTDQLYQSS